jgi:small subunit ribosomal protein S5
MVAEGEIRSMSEALRSGLVLREPEIVDILLPDMDDDVLDVNMVQRMTDSGRRVSFVITAVVGNADGFVGVARSHGKEVGPAIRKCIDSAKLNIIEVRRGCGSWECGCMTPHSLPFVVKGKSGSVEVTLRPAPRGVSLAVGDVVKSVLRLAGIKDTWGFAKGHTKTTVNFAMAAFNALKQGTRVKASPAQLDRLSILSGPEEAHVVEPVVPEAEEGGVAVEAAEGGEEAVEAEPEAAEAEKAVEGGGEAAEAPETEKVAKGGEEE